MILPKKHVTYLFILFISQSINTVCVYITQYLIWTIGVGTDNL